MSSLLHPLRHCVPVALLSFVTLCAAEPSITIEAGAAAGKVSPLHAGLMTEEINHCYDGGLYAELVQNRAFLDDAKSPVHWSPTQNAGLTAAITLDPSQPLNDRITTSLRLDARGAATSPAAIASVANDGFWGIPIQPHTNYQASFYAKAAPGFSGPILVSIQSPNGDTTYAEGKVLRVSGEWKPYEVTLTTGDVPTTMNARYVLSVKQPGTVWFSLVSLFPPTWNNQPNGFRKDLMQMLVDMHPKFLRFPGGNYLEGDTIATRFDWKKTLGPISQRSGHQGPWEYRSSEGLGLMEFLQWCEDMKAEPVLAVYAGYSFREQVKPGPDLEPYVKDALDEIEYLTGPTSSKWGGERAKDGHPEPFKLTYVEIGNEDFFDKTGSYDARFAQFYDAIKAHYPQLQCISTVGFEQPDKRRVHSRTPDAVDEHYYRAADEFVKVAPGYYEKYDRKGPKIFVGEWAAFEDPKIKPWTKGARNQPPTPDMRAAIGDAAWMAAMERNADHVVMQCYAPLFVNVNPGAYQWRPNLIGYDALKSFGSPSYYAICMFNQNIGDEILKASSTDTAVQTSATRDSKTGEIYLKLVNPTTTAQKVAINVKGVTSLVSTAAAITLAADPLATNSIVEPTKVVPVTTSLSDVKPGFSYEVPATGIVVLKLKR